MQSIQEYVPVTKAKINFLDMVRKIKHSDDTIAITKNGIPEVVLISMDRFDELLETIKFFPMKRQRSPYEDRFKKRTRECGLIMMRFSRNDPVENQIAP